MESEFQIGTWLVQPDLNCIVDNGRRVRLEPKTMELLVCLASSAPQVMSKEALLATVWSGTFVGDDALTHAIFELRKALGDDARESRVIETIPKRGYRLSAPVLRTHGQDASATGPAIAPSPAWRRGLPWAVVGALAGVLIAAAPISAAATVRTRQARAADPFCHYAAAGCTDHRRSRDLAGWQ